MRAIRVQTGKKHFFWIAMTCKPHDAARPIDPNLLRLVGNAEIVFIDEAQRVKLRF